MSPPYADPVVKAAKGREYCRKWRAKHLDDIRERQRKAAQRRYAEDAAFRETVRARVSVYQTRPGKRERRKAYMAEYNAKLRADPVRLEALRVYSREKQRRLRAVARQNPELREKRLAARKDRRKLTMKESVVEQYLCDEVKFRGGFCPKFTDPGRRGAPDRIVMLPGYPSYYVELKRPKLGYLEPWQRNYHREISAAGQQVFVLWSKEDVDAFFAALGERS